MTEQRYGYTYHRVLVDSTRVLDPQFPDAVIYVTGAQLELLRNMTQYLNRLSTYVSEYKPSYYLSPNVEDYDSIRAIVADLESVLMGNPNTIWGYHSAWKVDEDTTSTGAPTTYVYSGNVPAGYVYVLEHYEVQHTDLVTRGVELLIGDDYHRIYDVPALPGYENAFASTKITLAEGQFVVLAVTGLANGKIAYLRLLGYKMKVPE